MSNQFEKLKHKYTRSFGQKQKDIQAAWNEKDIKELEGLLHKLSGSSGSYEFHQLSQLCRQAMECISDNFELEDAELFERCLDALFVEMDKYSN